jgi:predicted dehydrogenase
MFFASEVICNMVAGYVKVGETSSWRVDIFGAEGALEIYPSDMEAGSLRLFRETEVIGHSFESAPNAFAAQAMIFCESIHGRNRCLNTPEATIGDIQVAEAIVLSARRREVVEIRNGL